MLLFEMTKKYSKWHVAVKDDIVNGWTFIRFKHYWANRPG